MKFENKILIAGPCAHEHSVDWLVEQAHAVREQTPSDWVLIFKTSFDKANRTELRSFRGLGLEHTLKAFSEIKHRFGCLVTTDIHEAWQAKELAPIVDVIQIPALLSRQTDLLLAAANNAAVVNIKTATGMSPEKAGEAVNKVKSHGTQSWLTYRGTGYGFELVFNPRVLWKLGSHAPVIADITHPATQRTDTLVYGKVAWALDVDGLFIECHPDPDNALSDAATQVRISNLRKLIEGVQER